MPGTSKSQAAPSARKFEFHGIQAMRFLAALMVIVCHSTFYTANRLAPDFYVYGKGANGVVLFFVISGFVMVISSSDASGPKISWGDFAAKRILRIVPLYWLVTSFKALVTIVAASLVLHANFDIGFILKSYFFIPAANSAGKLEPLLGVGWTLNFEMFFYALFCAALLFRINPLILVSPVLVIFSALSVMRQPDWPDALAFYSNAIVLDFLLGMIVGYLALRRMFLPTWLSFGLIPVCLVLLFLPRHGEGIANSLVDGAPFDGAMAFLVIYACVSLEALRGFSVPKIVSFFGAASYSLYLAHPLIAPAAPEVFAKLGLQHLPVLSVLASIVIALIGGALVYRLVEMPLTNLLKPAFRPFMGAPRVQPK